MSLLNRITGVLGVAAVAVITGTWPVNADGRPGPSRPPATYSVADAKARYVRNADAACREWTSRIPAGPNGSTATITWNQQMADLRSGMLTAWAAVPVPEAFVGKVRELMELHNAAQASFLVLKDTYYQGAKYGWTAEVNQRFAVEKAEYNRRNATAVQQTNAFTLRECADEWVHWT